MAKPNATPMRVIEETPGYWRAVFDYPPFNVVDGDVFQALQDLLVRMETTESLRVVVFESALPDFYLSHFDLTGKLGNIMSAIGPTGLPILMDTFVRLTKAPVVSLARIRGCVRGVSSEFVLACDMRFASRENTKLGHPELGVGLHPGGGGTERLPHLVGRGRALEIVLSANDFDGDTAERYGYVNRSLPDAELDGFVDALARRIGSFDRRALVAAKISSTRSRCRRSIGSSTPLLRLEQHSGGPKPRTVLEPCWSADCNVTPPSRRIGPRSSARSSRPARKAVGMIAKVEVERFNLISSRPFDEILAAIKAAVGHPDMVAFAKRTAAAPTFSDFESIVREGLGKTGGGRNDSHS